MLRVKPGARSHNHSAGSSDRKPVCTYNVQPQCRCPGRNLPRPQRGHTSHNDLFLSTLSKQQTDQSMKTADTSDECNKAGVITVSSLCKKITGTQFRSKKYMKYPKLITSLSLIFEAISDTKHNLSIIYYFLIFHFYCCFLCKDFRFKPSFCKCQYINQAWGSQVAHMTNHAWLQQLR